ncbi:MULTISPECIES: DUF2935 domain-containing protein [Geobacillus]|jgi:hypothetical protein|uniref:DUF2935 domain-containing protein n=2 Tax=Geobacillus thermodenitrificans TaxID=33940 RepID=A4IMT0_GEOTN|nr:MULTISPECIES: DUF2935 domain-containing protein [Geobacillus]ABO66634.1 Conserved hypothetical protein [Geobacillus thermodenitrificans NG80-2]ARA97001.1 hypothetical protein GD3902_02420 [Geobacillus thermodenitrificans]ARP42391.1 hypothetical protein GTHT12_00835 [Geobacillus thermodenitrificans]ATO36276.1 hypothetical protein GTID1_03015 [Geobacillus thermodenitrificans]KQB93604.1 hypothetical protein GEPA3_1329 [Geobacillus sp. PA-3]
MQFYYGPHMPLRILDEIEFWKHQEEEHTVVIRELVSGLEARYVDALKKWEEALSVTHQQAVRYIESVIRVGYYVPEQLYQQVLHFVSFCLQQSLQFIELCRQVKTKSAAVAQNPTAKVVLDHIIRESEYFIGIAQLLLYGTQTAPAAPRTNSQATPDGEK